MMYSPTYTNYKGHLSLTTKKTSLDVLLELRRIVLYAGIDNKGGKLYTIGVLV